MILEKAIFYLVPAAVAAVLITLAVAEIRQIAGNPSSSASGRKRGSPGFMGKFKTNNASAHGSTNGVHFRQPAKGSKYAVSYGTTVWIQPVSKTFYKVYYICGDKPSEPLMKDFNGLYFTVRAKTQWEAEDKIRRAFR